MDQGSQKSLRYGGALLGIGDTVDESNLSVQISKKKENIMYINRSKSNKNVNCGGNRPCWLDSPDIKDYKTVFVMVGH